MSFFQSVANISGSDCEGLKKIWLYLGFVVCRQNMKTNYIWDKYILDWLLVFGKSQLVCFCHQI